MKTRSSTFSEVLSFARVSNSSLGEQNGNVLYDTTAVGDDTTTGDAGSDTRDGQMAFSAVGHYVRPPSKPDAEQPDLLLEALTARTSDGNVPFAYRDQRILKWLNRGSSSPSVPKPGQSLIAGYGGAFLSFETKDESNGPVNVVALYCPFDRDGQGVPRKSHMLILDPTNGGAVSLIHSTGLAILMTEAEGIVLRGDATTRLVVKPGEVSITAGRITAQGIVALGANPAAAIPLLPGLASQPTPSVMFSPT